MNVEPWWGVCINKFMLILFDRSPWGKTSAFYGISKLIFVKKLSHFEVRDFDRISYKKHMENFNFGILYINLNEFVNLCPEKSSFSAVFQIFCAKVA